MSQYKWWKYRPNKLTRGQVIQARTEQERLITNNFVGSAGDNMDDTRAHIISEEIEIVNGFHTGQTVSEAIESLHDRVNAQEYAIDYNINNGNCLDLTNALRDLSMEGYMDNELKEVLRVMLERYRSGQVHI
jgi:hypothetical protein